MSKHSYWYFVRIEERQAPSNQLQKDLQYALLPMDQTLINLEPSTIYNDGAGTNELKASLDLLIERLNAKHPRCKPLERWHHDYLVRFCYYLGVRDRFEIRIHLDHVSGALTCHDLGAAHDDELVATCGIYFAENRFTMKVHEDPSEERDALRFYLLASINYLESLADPTGVYRTTIERARSAYDRDDIAAIQKIIDQVTLLARI